MIRLAGNLDGFESKLSGVETLVGLAARMVDDADLLLVTALLSNDASGFLELLNYHKQTLDLTVRSGKCSRDGATVAKGQEISRIYSDAGSLVQSIVDRIGASPQGRDTK
jgi:hypothetical protein